MTPVPAEVEVVEAETGFLARRPPFFLLLVILLLWCYRRERARLRWEAHFWRGQHTWGQQRVAELRKKVDVLKARIRELEQGRYGNTSERKRGSERTGQGKRRRKRGQQPGSSGHGRSGLPDLPVQEELADLEEEKKCCPGCGSPLEPFPGSEDSEVVEVEVRAYRRRIRRRRYRPGCSCGRVPGIVAAPAPARLIPRGKLGVSVWAEVLLDKFLYLRPTHRLLQQLADHGLKLSPGTVADGLQRLAGLFEPLCQAIRKHQLLEGQWHGDETSWRVFVLAEGKRTSRWFLWVFCSRSTACYILRPSRAAEVAEAHFGKAFGWLVCDRYSVYKKLAKPGRIWLAHCWAHVRRDFLKVAVGRPRLQDWSADWVQRIGELFRLNHQRLEALKRPRREGFAPVNRQLREALQDMRQEASRQLQKRPLPAPCRKVLESLQNHWETLTVFVKRPQIPMDNNAAERALRGPVVGRKNFYGSGSERSAQLAAAMFTVLQTVRRCGLNPRSWLLAFLQACAEHGGQPPPDLSPFLPWQMDPQQKARLKKPCQGAL